MMRVTMLLNEPQRFSGYEFALALQRPLQHLQHRTKQPLATM
jgi:hypothetical protein